MAKSVVEIHLIIPWYLKLLIELVTNLAGAWWIVLMAYEGFLADVFKKNTSQYSEKFINVHLHSLLFFLIDKLSIKKVSKIQQ